MAGNATRALKVLITGDAKGALDAFRKTEKGAGGLGDKLKKMGAVTATATVAAAGAVVGFGKKAANTFKTVGQETMKLMRVTGMSAESASKLRFAFQQTGIAVDVGARSLAMFGKKITASKDTMKDFGIRTRDTHGRLLPMSELINRAADRLSKMKDSTERNALAMKLFGKSGVEMTKLLDKGRLGMSKLAAEAEKYGLVLTKDNIEAVRKSIKAHRQQDAAMQGLQVQIGMHVLPVLTKFTSLLATQIPKVTNWIKAHKQSGKIIGGVFVAALAIATGAMLGLAAATLAATWEFVVGALAIAALVAGVIYAYKHWAWFRNAIKATVKFLKDYAWPIIKLWAKGFKLEFQMIAAYARVWWKVVTTVVKAAIDGIRFAIAVGTNIIHGNWRAAWEQIKSVASGAWDKIKAGALTGISTLESWFRSLPGKITSALAGMAGTLYNTGVHWMAGLIHGIESLAGNVVKAIVSKIPGSGLIKNVADSIFGSGGGGGGGGKSLRPSGARSLTVPTASTSSAAGGSRMLHVTTQLVVDGKVLAETTRNHAIDRQRQTGRAWLPAMA